jgi:hypothetical protein
MMNKSRMKFLFTMSLAVLAAVARGQELSLDGFVQWRTGHDGGTQQLMPETGADPLVKVKGKVVAHVWFNVEQYGEMSFPIDPSTAEGEEAKKTDLSGSKFVRVCYRANHPVILQLRQTGVHGGVHNHVVLPASAKFITRKIPFTRFKGGKTPLDLSDVAKFNFAFLSNNPDDGYAELIVRSFMIDGYRAGR